MVELCVVGPETLVVSETTAEWVCVHSSFSIVYFRNSNLKQTRAKDVFRPPDYCRTRRTEKITSLEYYHNKVMPFPEPPNRNSLRTYQRFHSAFANRDSFQTSSFFLSLAYADFASIHKHTQRAYIHAFEPKIPIDLFKISIDSLSTHPVCTPIGWVWISFHISSAKWLAFSCYSVSCRWCCCLPPFPSGELGHEYRSFGSQRFEPFYWIWQAAKSNEKVPK